MILPLGTYTYDWTLGTFWSQRNCQCIYSSIGFFFSHIFYLISLESMENFESPFTFCKEIHIFPINSVYSEHCTSRVQFLDDSICTGRKKNNDCSLLLVLFINLCLVFPYFISASDWRMLGIQSLLTQNQSSYFDHPFCSAPHLAQCCCIYFWNELSNWMNINPL